MGVFDVICNFQSLDLEILPPVSLYCHTAKVTCLSVCGSFRIFVSGSDDETAAIWDLDSMSYIRSLTGHAGRVTSLAISSTCGDICTVCESGMLCYIVETAYYWSSAKVLLEKLGFKHTFVEECYWLLEYFYRSPINRGFISI